MKGNSQGAINLLFEDVIVDGCAGTPFRVNKDTAAAVSVTFRQCKSLNGSTIVTVDGAASVTIDNQGAGNLTL